METRPFIYSLQPTVRVLVLGYGPLQYYHFPICWLQKAWSPTMNMGMKCGIVCDKRMLRPAAIAEVEYLPSHVTFIFLSAHNPTFG